MLFRLIFSNMDSLNDVEVACVMFVLVEEHEQKQKKNRKATVSASD
jgi:hypothetical protein